MTRENLSLGFLTRSDTNRAEQPQKMIRSLKFRIQEVESLYYICRETKGAYQLHGHCAADLHLCFCNCDNRFTNDAAHILNIMYNTPMQYTAIICGCKNQFFSVFGSYKTEMHSLALPYWCNSNEYSQSMF